MNPNMMDMFLGMNSTGSPTNPGGSSTTGTLPPYILNLLGGSQNQNLMAMLNGTANGANDITAQSAPLALLNGPQSLGQNYFSYGPQTGDAFKQLIGSINAQDTSVLDPLLQSIDTQTAQNEGSTMSDFQARGLGGPGQASTIEENALTGVREGGGLEKENVMSNFLQNKANELTGAYGSAYNAANEGALSGANSYNQLLGQLSSTLNNIWGQNQNAWQQYEQQQWQSGNQPGVFSNFLNSLASAPGSAAQGFGQAGGKALGTALF